MRRSIWPGLFFAFCEIFVSQSQFAKADDNRGSTIRLCSATEPVRTNGCSSIAPQPQAADSDRDLPPAPTTLPIVPTSPSAEPSINNSPPMKAATSAVPPVVNRPRMPAGFYPSAAARATLAQMPGSVPVQSAPRNEQSRRGTKPFQGIQAEPTISPYLYLNAGTNNGNFMTNYLAFVRPQIDQQEANRQRDLQQLRSQVQKMQKMSSGGAVQQAGEMHAAAHYMDTAQFYRGLQR